MLKDVETSIVMASFISRFTKHGDMHTDPPRLSSCFFTSFVTENFVYFFIIKAYFFIIKVMAFPASHFSWYNFEQICTLETQWKRRHRAQRGSHQGATTRHFRTRVSPLDAARHRFRQKFRLLSEDFITSSGLLAAISARRRHDPILVPKLGIFI